MLTKRSKRTVAANVQLANISDAKNCRTKNTPGTVGMNKSTHTPEEMDRLFAEHLEKLTRFADSRLSGKLGSKFDGDDVAATVCRTVWRRYQEGKFDFDDDAGFWRLLITIAVRKISNKVRKFNTKSRNIENEIPEVANEIANGLEPGPDEAASFQDLLQCLTARLDESERKIFESRCANKTNQEIADELSIAERTVRRKMQVIKEKLKEIFFETDEK